MAEADSAARVRSSISSRGGRWIVPLVVVLAIAAGAAFWIRSLRARPGGYDTAPVTRGDVAKTITASGTVNPVTTVQVGSYVSGVIESVTCDFNKMSQIQNAAEGSSRVMALLLATVASISLLVGGIGIMNILLVSVTERTREIGLRTAIGARRTDVLLQFLAEAVFLSVTGGIAGIIVGVVTARLISTVAGWPTQVSVAAIAGGFIFSAAFGIFLGYYPARKASRLDPMEALRFE